MTDDLATLLDPGKATTEAEFAAVWERCLQPSPAAKPSAPRRKTTTPRVGTSIERSSGTHERKIQELMEVPPPPSHHHDATRKSPPRKKQKTNLEDLFGDLSDLDNNEITTADQSTTAPAPVIHGPPGPPPVEITVDGHTVQVPYFATTVSRKFKARVGDKRYLLRFDRTGQCMYARKI